MPSAYPPNSTWLKFSVREQIGWPVWFVFGFFWTILPKNGYLFAHFSSFLKKVASFSRAQASWFSRGRLARQAPAFGWDGHRGRPTSRWSDIAVVRHRCGRTSRCVVIQLVTHHHGHTTRTIYLTTIRNQWLYTIKVFPGKMIRKCFKKMIWTFFFEKLEITQFAKWSNNTFFNLPCNFHLNIVDLATVSKNGHRNSMLGAYVAETFNSP